MENIDFLTKELVHTFTFTTANSDREGATEVNIYGRRYIKLGTYQAMTYVGLLYKAYDKYDKTKKYVLCIGRSRQHQNDVKVDKELAYEVAQQNAMMSPISVTVYDKRPDGHVFKNLVNANLCNTKVKFLRTQQEIDASNKVKGLNYWLE